MENAKLNISYIINHADEIWYNVRWKDGVKCIDCGSDDYYRLQDGRYKCKKCGRIFSDVSGTLLHHSKVDKWKWLYTIYKMSNGNGISNVELAKDVDVNVKTAWLLQQKVRYAIGQEGINLSGLVCMDEAYVGGWCGMHFSKKMKFMNENNFLDENGKYNKSTLLAAVSKKKHHIVSMVGEDKDTLLLHTPNPITKDVIEQVLNAHTSNLTTLVTDESKLYQSLKNVTVEQSCHSKGVFMTTGHHTSNPCENRFSWVKRKVKGIYTHTSDKYLQLYLNQMAFSNNHLNDTIEERFNALLSTCTHTYVSTRTILTYDYLSTYNVIDVYEAERKEAQEILDTCSIIQSVETKHHVKLHR